jgi:hypothetical protein
MRADVFTPWRVVVRAVRDMPESRIGPCPRLVTGRQSRTRRLVSNTSWVLMIACTHAPDGLVAEADFPTPVRTGVSIPIRYRVTNAGSDTIYYEDLVPLQAGLVVWVLRPDRSEVWVNGREQVAGPVKRYALAPGAHHDYHAEWTQTDEAGKQVPAGTYIIKAFTGQAYVRPREAPPPAERELVIRP